VENIHIRAREDKDVKHYLQPMNIYKIGVNLNSLMEEVYIALQIIVEERLQYLSQLNFLNVNSQELHNKIFRKDLLNLNKELTTIIRGDGDKTGVYTAISVNAQALILYHMLALVEQQGLDILLEYLEKLQKDSKKKSSSKAVKLLAMDYRLKKIYIELKRHHEYFPENIIHPKYQVLEKIIIEELEQNPDSRVLVFVKLRDSVKNIVLKLKENDSVRCRRFVGQATKSKDDKGLSQKEQITILDQFKKGMYNVLVSTNVGEEGLDIAECDLVIFYDVVASETRLIQRKGRTARRRKGKVIILYCKDTHDEIYLRIALSKLKKMNITLRNPIELKNYRDIKVETNQKQAPTVREKTIITPEFVELNTKRQSSLGDFLHKPKQARVKKVVSQEILISKTLPQKFGLKNKLENEKIGYDIVKSRNKIIICDKILIQIFNPKISLLSDVNSFAENNVKKFKIVINLIDFVDFVEDYENEKKRLKKKIQDYGILNDLQIIPIDNVEELFFIVKNLYENVKKGEA
jgi:ERCC4-related helicase